MKFFCRIALRDWFINLCDCILRAGERALDQYWPCGTCVFLPTRKFATSQGKCLREGYGTSNEPRPPCLASSICLFACFFHHNLILYHERRNARAEVLILTAHSQAFANQSINQSEEGLNSNRDLIISVFKSLIVAITFSSHKACKVYTF